MGADILETIVIAAGGARAAVLVHRPAARTDPPGPASAFLIAQRAPQLPP